MNNAMQGKYTKKQENTGQYKFLFIINWILYSFMKFLSN